VDTKEKFKVEWDDETIGSACAVFENSDKAVRLI
jgi:hypothetical protein